MHSWLEADWSAPANIRAGTTLRTGGVSEGPYQSFNLATHVGDDPQHVMANRAMLQVPRPPAWLEQVHGIEVARLDGSETSVIRADAAWTDQPGVVCAVMTADCLPVLLTNRTGSKVAAIHAGWRGLCQGIIEATLDAMQVGEDEMIAWLGPAIGPDVYEIGAEVREAFCQQNSEAAKAFQPTRPGHWLMDIYHLAQQRLHRLGIDQVSGGQYCTYSQDAQFYSYRRDGVTGRMASLIWIE